MGKDNFGQKFESKEDQKSGGKFYLPMSAHLGLRDYNWSIPAKVWGESEEPVIEIYTEYKFREQSPQLGKTYQKHIEDF